jgi:DNA polymerase-1
MMTGKNKRFIIIDSNSVIHRAYHALPPLSTKKGELVNAVYGFLLVFFKAIKEFRPDYIVASFDFPAPTFRHKEFKEYKATRPKAPDELYDQIPKVKEVLRTFNVPIFEKEGFEADDIIGTISALVPKKQIVPKMETIVLSGDFDILQLVSPHTKVYILRRGVKNTILYDEKLVKKRYGGLDASKLPDLVGLKGDISDNIPGVPGVGEKTAIFLIKKFGSIENLYKELGKRSEKSRDLKEKLKETLLRSKDQALFSKFLATIKCDVPIELKLEECYWKDFKEQEVIKTLEKFEFSTLIKRLKNRKDNISLKCLTGLSKNFLIPLQ